MMALNIDKKFENYSKFHEGLCNLKMIRQKLPGRKTITKVNYKDCRYLDALARLFAYSDKFKCAAVFIRKKTSVVNSLKNEVCCTQKALKKSHSDWLKTKQGIRLMKALTIGKISANTKTEDLSGIFKTLNDTIKDIANNTNEDALKSLLTKKQDKFNIIQGRTKPTIYLSFNEISKPTMRISGLIIEGIKQSIRKQEPELLVKVVAMSHFKYSYHLKEFLNSKEFLRSNGNIGDKLKKLSQKLTESIQKIKFDHSNVLTYEIFKEIPYEALMNILEAKGVPDKLKKLIKRVFQDALKLFHVLKNHEEWSASELQHEVIENPDKLHAEIALIKGIIDNEKKIYPNLPVENCNTIIPYVGISKLCCVLCHLTLKKLGIKHLGTHKIWYAGVKTWKFCDIHSEQVKRDLVMYIKRDLLRQVKVIKICFKSGKDVKEDFTDQHPDLSDDEDDENCIKLKTGGQTLWAFKKSKM